MTKVGLALIVVAVAAAGYFVVGGVVDNIESSLEELTAVRLQEIDLASIADGTYKGSFGLFPISAEVYVTVEDGAMTEIELVEHTHGRGADAESIPDSVLEAQNLAVDAVSGATYSSQIIIRAIEDALIKAQK